MDAWSHAVVCLALEALNWKCKRSCQEVQSRPVVHDASKQRPDMGHHDFGRIEKTTQNLGVFNVEYGQWQQSANRVPIGCK